MQVDPIKPKLKPPRTKRLKLKYDVLLSNYAFKFHLRRYNQVMPNFRIRTMPVLGAGIHTRPLFSST